MYKLVRSIFVPVAMVLTTLTLCSASGCKNPFAPDPPAKRFFGGAIYNKSANTAFIALTNPPAEYSSGTDVNKNYSLRRTFEAMNNGVMGVQSYWLHQKVQGADQPYRFELTTPENNHLAYIDVYPNGTAGDAPTPDTSQPGLDWWYVYPDGGHMYSLSPVDRDRALAQIRATAPAEMTQVAPLGGER